MALCTHLASGTAENWVWAPTSFQGTECLSWWRASRSQWRRWPVGVDIQWHSQVNVWWQQIRHVIYLFISFKYLTENNILSWFPPSFNLTKKLQNALKQGNKILQHAANASDCVGFFQREVCTRSASVSSGSSAMGHSSLSPGCRVWLSTSRRDEPVRWPVEKTTPLSLQVNLSSVH